MPEWEHYLKSIYYDPAHPVSYAGAQKLYKVVKREGKYDIGMYRIRKFLSNQESYSLHKPVRRRFQRNHIVSAGPRDLWMADLIDMVKYAEWNDDYRYILLVIDTFTKYVWLRPLKRKTGEMVLEAFSDIFQKSMQTPKKLITDKGQEFRAKKVQDLMKRNGVTYFPTQNETKASISERAILTIRQKLTRYFTHQEDYVYLPVLQKFADSYNGTFHRTIGMAPADVDDNNAEEVRLSSYFAKKSADKKYTVPKHRRYRFKLGDYVRISHLKTIFTRAYDETYSNEVFQIARRYMRGSIPIYRLKDMQQEDIKGTFYESELQIVRVEPDQLWKVDEILRTRGKGSKKQFYVKWKHYPSKFNTWIKATDLK